MLQMLVGCSVGKPGISDGSSRRDAAVIFDIGPLPDVGPPPNDDPIEPVWRSDVTAARVKSPGQRMHFTAGVPFRVLADGQDIKAFQCSNQPPYSCPDSSMAFLIDGVAVHSVPPDQNNQDLWELRVPQGLPAGNHILTVRFTPHDAAPVDGAVPVYITIDPLPMHAKTVNLTADVVLTGNSDLNWTDAVVNGNGYRVTAGDGYTGKITIHNSFVTGLAAFDNQVGLNVTTQGAVDISGTIFEATAPLQLVVNGSAPISIVGNEFRSNNYVTYVSADPTKSPILNLAGNTSGAKVMKGNNIGGGIVLITGMNGWQIGGLHDGDANIFVGPRCVLELEGSSQAKIQGNYIHHDYHGGFSQGFNLQFGNSSDSALAEHNVLRGSSWPLQNFGGEFRYNLIIDSGHDFIRSSQTGARYHHNVIVHSEAANDEYDGAMLIYSTETNIAFDNNTVDAGGELAAFNAPVIVAKAPKLAFASLRNNVFSQFVDTNSNWLSKSFIAGDLGEKTVGTPRVAVADYNAWYNPAATNTGHYTSGIVASTAGAHDVSDAPMFNGAVPQAPYQVDEGAVWLRKYGVSQVLAYYRALYTPKPGSPLIDSGDPADGAGNDIGAIGAGAANAADKFGLVLAPN